MYFLQQQCGRGLESGYGWTACRYGEGVDCEGCVSWICSAGNGSSGAHKIDSSSECGKGGKKKPSPLQAFLCDCLPGFTCEKIDTDKVKTLTSNNQNDYLSCYPEVRTHLEHSRSKPGTDCPVPMGFSGSFRSRVTGGAPAPGGRDMIGLGMVSSLEFYSNDDISTSGLYQITRCICSLTRRVPRSTGTLYGFFYGLGGSITITSSAGSQQLNGDFTTALKDELRCCPGHRNPECLLGAVGNMRSSGNKCESLYGLTQCDGGGKDQSNQTCGKYLYPLTGSLYNSVAPQFCETYVSWIVHLSWRLHDGLESLLKEFVKIDCQKSGCSTKTGSHCCQGGKDHGKDCQCANVVQCVGVHGLFYRFGFSYGYTSALAGNNGGNWVRKCSTFYQQLKNVIEQEPFKKLQTQLRKFMYTTRALFGVYIGVYWSIVMGYLVYSMAVNLDLMHIQSHWRSPRSYLVPLQRILADGSPKGFCTLGYFQEGTGDRLLSLGVSDVYL